jgi:predicted phosphodiesterase
MRIAVIADLHANAEAVQAVLEHSRTAGIDRLVFLGDCVGYGADPAWVVDRVREHVHAGAIAVRGNHDAAVAHGAPPSMRDEARRVIDWTRARLDETQIRFLGTLPLAHELGELLFVHANAYEPAGWGYVDCRARALRSLRATRQRIVFCGHLHEPRLYHLSKWGRAGELVPAAGQRIPLRPPRRWLAMLGAAGQPRDGDPAACYAIYDDSSAELTYWRVPYDHQAASAKIRAAELPPSLAARLAAGQ